MTIHDEHPFATPEPDRDPLRRLRGRLAAPVTVWTTGSGTDREGWTVSSMLIADGAAPGASGRPAEVLGLLDEESELVDALRRTGTVSVNLLPARQEPLAEAFARTMPAPGGPFRMGEWRDTEWGPRLAGVPWLGARVIGEPTYAGWALLVRAAIEQLDVAGAEPAIHLRGQYLDPSVLSKP
ncbi:flavin reductase family protein [Enemella evansiae]|uniref:flavin reductase family protein n=1 Tax=Enemella evansiae TaxID=2016499 RepID=UPI00105E780C|nr:flavin reductase [Enemella evansiae]TDO92677.1 flavin reductase (DIM6/NTAB) family NADH-FMN oxidoreductase RutF [Enemella evansiae]